MIDHFLKGYPLQTECPGCKSDSHWVEAFEEYDAEDGTYDLWICKKYVPAGDGWERDCNTRVFFKRSLR